MMYLGMVNTIHFFQHNLLGPYLQWIYNSVVFGDTDSPQLHWIYNLDAFRNTESNAFLSV